MITYTDTQLKSMLAKMLPEQLSYHDEGLTEREAPQLYWLCQDEAVMFVRDVLDTELLHLCWLVEETLTPVQRDDYYYDGIRGGDKELDHAWCVSAPWQQRVIALAKVKGIEIV